MSSPRYRVMVSQSPASVPKPYRDRTHQTYEAAEAARDQALDGQPEEVVAWIEVEETTWVIAHA
jgi:hypothetical protein